MFIFIRCTLLFSLSNCWQYYLNWSYRRRWIFGSKSYKLLWRLKVPKKVHLDHKHYPLRVTVKRKMSIKSEAFSLSKRNNFIQFWTLPTSITDSCQKTYETSFSDIFCQNCFDADNFLICNHSSTRAVQISLLLVWRRHR